MAIRADEKLRIHDFSIVYLDNCDRVRREDATVFVGKIGFVTNRR